MMSRQFSGRTLARYRTQPGFESRLNEQWWIVGVVLSGKVTITNVGRAFAINLFRRKINQTSIVFATISQFFLLID